VKRKPALKKLAQFIQFMVSCGVVDHGSWKSFAAEHKVEIGQLFDYPQEEELPAITSLVKPFFHPTLPLIGLNYTPVAHNVLYMFPQGWTDQLRLCRGIIFDRTGQLVALSFPKFFNHGEHPETQNLPKLPFEATLKQDGHLGIIFRYQHEFVLTTRGSFESRSSVLGNTMLTRYVRENNWKKNFPTNLTLLVEIIHPDTKVFVDYQGQKRFTIISANSTATMADYGYRRLMGYASKLGLEVTPIWTGKSESDPLVDLRKNITSLVEMMGDRAVQNTEGYVIRFSNGLRVKVKFQTYIGYMVADKLSFTYLMNRMVSGNLERMLLTLPEEIYQTALGMLGQILLHLSSAGSPKDKWRKLYTLLPDDEATSYFKSICRKFTKHMTSPE
jgi:RNA ligase